MWLTELLRGLECRVGVMGSALRGSPGLGFQALYHCLEILKSFILVKAVVCKGTMDQEVGGLRLGSCLASHRLPVPGVWFSTALPSVPYSPSCTQPSPPHLHSATTARLPPTWGQARRGWGQHAHPTVPWGGTWWLQPLPYSGRIGVHSQSILQGQASGPPVPRIWCIQCVLGVARLLKVGAGSLCKERPDPTSCRRLGATHVWPATGEEERNLTFRLQGKYGSQVTRQGSGP